MERSDKPNKLPLGENMKLKRSHSKVMKIPLRYNNINSNSQELAVTGSGSMIELSQVSYKSDKSVASNLGNANTNNLKTIITIIININTIIRTRPI